MKFSVIIPVYNCERTLSTSVESILTQTHSDWELILVNDGSKDDSRTLCEKYAEKDNRVKLINQENSGPSAARNKGLAECIGDYVIFCDADDCLQRDTLEKISKKAEKQDFDIAFYGYSDCVITEEKECRVLREHRASEFFAVSNEDFRKKYKELDALAFTYPVWNKAYRLEFLRNSKAQFPVGVMVAEDFVFNLQLYVLAEKVLVIDECFYKYIQSGSSITNRFDVRKIDNVEYVFTVSLNAMSSWNPDLKNKIYNSYVRDIGVFINNMFNKGVSLSAREKRALLKSILKRKSVRECVKNIKPMSSRNKILVPLIRFKSVFLLLCIGKMSRIGRG